jgi:short-subunit dehydrogenase
VGLEEVAALVRDRGAQAHIVAADLTAPGAPAEVVGAAQERFGGVDVLINNAGNVRAGRLEALAEDEVVAQIALNLTAPILLTRAALPALRASGDGLVVNVSSGIGLVALPFYATYAATKAGIAHFGDALRRELYGEGVHVLTVYPGATSTPMMASSQAGPEHGFQYESPDDVAAATIDGMVDGSLAVVRGGERRRQMIELSRTDPGEVDRLLAARKSALEEAVAGHSSL